MSDSQQTILRSVSTVTLLTVGVKGIGFIQQALVANRFGTGARIEAYFLSLAIPGILASLIPVTLTAGALPVYLALRQNEGEARARRFLGACLGTYAAVLLAVAGVVAFAAGPIVAAVTGRTAERDLIVQLGWASSPLIFLAGLFATLVAIENSRGKFVLTTALQCLPAAAIIVFLVALPRLDVWGIALGMLAGMALQLAVIFISARPALPGFHGMTPARDPALGLAGSRILPLFLSSSIVQLNPLVDQVMASTLPAGSLSALAYADKIMHVLQALFITSVSTVGLVSFSRQVAEKRHDEVILTLHNLVRTLAFVLLPISAGTVIVARPLVAVLLERGAFSAASTTAVSQALCFFALGLFPIGASFLLPQAFIALGATRTLAVVAVGENLLNVVLNLILMRRFAHSGIAFSTSLVYAIGVVLLALLLPSKLAGLKWRPIAAPLLRIATATAAMTLCCLATRQFVSGSSDAVALAAVVAVGVVAYLSASRVLGVAELGRLWSALAAERHR